jgi:nitroreductase
LETIEAITTRRSVNKTAEGVPDRGAIAQLIDAAIAAPNHHLTEPWRFVVLTGDALKEMGAAWAAGEARLGGDPEKVRDKPLRAPVIITVIERPNRTNPKVVEVEEHHAVGAAMQNMLLAAHATGLATMLRTGPAARTPEVEEYLGVEPGEFIAGFVYVGYEPEGFERKAPRKTPASDLTSWRGWDKQ